MSTRNNRDPKTGRGRVPGTRPSSGGFPVRNGDPLSNPLISTGRVTRPAGSKVDDLLGDSSLAGVIGSNYGNQQPSNNYLQILNNAAYGSDSLFVDWLAQQGFTGADSLTETQKQDWNKQMAEMYANYVAESERREYEKGVLQEQRVYDSPTNVLARLMGAGISRDAAIQLLSGSAGGGSALSPGNAAALGAGIAPSESNLNDINAKTGIANTVFNGVGALIGLTQLGFSIPQAIQQTKALQYSNYLTGEQISAYKNAASAYKILNSVGAGVDAFGSVANAISTIQKLSDDGNVDASNFIANGGVDSLRLNSPFASRVLNGLYHSERGSDDYTRDMDNHFLQEDLRNSILQMDALKAHREFELMAKQLLQADADLAETYQRIRNGEIQIKIGKQTLRAATYKNDVDQVYHDAYLEAMNNGYDGSYSGKQLLSESVWRELYGHWRRLAVEQSPENVAAYEKYLQDNFDAACAMATIRAASSRQLSDAWNSDENDLGEIWTRFTNIFFGTKTDQMLNLVGNAAELGSTLYLGTHNQNFVP